ncbi:MAG: prepilin peptidase, partial [Gammaproteobacteria bacterium]
MAFIELLQTTPSLFIAVVTFWGLLVGSFLNVVIYRLPIMMEREWRAQCNELNGKDSSPIEPFTLSIPRSR